MIAPLMGLMAFAFVFGLIVFCNKFDLIPQLIATVILLCVGYSLMLIIQHGYGIVLLVVIVALLLA